MRTFELTSEVMLPRPPAEVFPFFADARNLERLTPAWLRFEVLTAGPIEMRPGAAIDYRLRLRGVPIRWRSEITAWEPPFRFVDEQRRGPYRLWVHEHRFEEREGRTLASDHVPLRGLGRAHRRPPAGAARHRAHLRVPARRVARALRNRGRLNPPGSSGAAPAGRTRGPPARSYRLKPRSSCSARSRPSDSSSAVTRRPIVASSALARMKVSTPE